MMSSCYFFVSLLSISYSFHYSSWRCDRLLFKSQKFHTSTKLLDNDSKSVSSPPSLSSPRIIHRIGIDDITTHSKLNSNLDIDIPEQFSTFGKSSATLSPGDCSIYSIT